jgi:hypothetical protein
MKRHNLSTAIDIIKEAIGSTDNGDDLMVFQLGQDKSIFQIIHMQNANFFKYKRICENPGEKNI